VSTKADIFVRSSTLWTVFAWRRFWLYAVSQVRA